MGKRICDAAVLAGTKEILIDLRAAEGTPTVLEHWELGLAIVEYRRDLPISKIAIVGKAPTVTGFGAVVSQNRGANTQSFSSREEAVAWLSQE